MVSSICRMISAACFIIFVIGMIWLGVSSNRHDGDEKKGDGGRPVTRPNMSMLPGQPQSVDRNARPVPTLYSDILMPENKAQQPGTTTIDVLVVPVQGLETTRPDAKTSTAEGGHDQHLPGSSIVADENSHIKQTPEAKAVDGSIFNSPGAAALRKAQEENQNRVEDMDVAPYNSVSNSEPKSPQGGASNGDSPEKPTNQRGYPPA